MEVEAAVQPPHLNLLVRDHGRGLVPRLGSQGLGMGLPLIASLSDTLDVRTTERATEVRMAFRLARPRDTAALDAV